MSKFICSLEIISSCPVCYLSRKMLSPNVSVLFLKRFSDLFLSFLKTLKEQQGLFRLSSDTEKIPDQVLFGERPSCFVVKKQK